MLKFICTISFFYLVLIGCKTTTNVSTTKSFIMDSLLKGTFIDDYENTYIINDSIFFQQPNMLYQILKWNKKGQYLIAKNNASTKNDTASFIRIDYMYFTNMQPYNWGFCYTTYNAKSIEEAEKKGSADRANPRKGCGGYPFSRMKRANL